MAKEQKYEVDKVETKAGDTGFYFAIWFDNHDIVFWTEASAKKACEMLNAAHDLAKIKRKVRDLSFSLEQFTDHN